MNPTSLHTVRRTVAPALLGLLVLATAACGSSADADDDVPLDPAGATCLEGTEDCNDTDLPIDDPDPSAGMCAPDVTDCDDTGRIEAALERNFVQVAVVDGIPVLRRR